MKPRSLKLLVDIAFRTSILFIFFSISGCFSYNPDYENQLWINNLTSDTLTYQFTRKYIADGAGGYTLWPPGKNNIGNHHTYSSFKMLETEWKYRGDTIEILREGYKTIKWAAPLREMPDSVHHFFNKNSWDIKMGGHKDEWEIATFTFTEEDFKKQ